VAFFLRVLVVVAGAAIIPAACASFDAENPQPIADAGTPDAPIVEGADAHVTDAGAPARYLYVYGGNMVRATDDGGLTGGFVRTSYRAPLLPEGGLGPWAVVPELEATQAFAASVTPEEGVVVAIAGERAPFSFNSSAVSVAALPPVPGADASAWHESSPILDQVSQMAAAAEGGWIVASGGVAGSPAVRHDGMFTTRLLPGGAGVGVWTRASALPKPLSGHAMAILGERLYLVGGTGSTGPATATTYVAKRTPDGGIGPWQAARALTVGVTDHSLVAIGPWLYLVGSASPDNAGTKAVWRASSDADGGLTWAGVSPLVVPTAAPCVVADGHTLYVIGGHGFLETLASVQAVRVLDDGTLGAWTTLEPMPEGRYGFGCAIR
jgi:hypothetical protein